MKKILLGLALLFAATHLQAESRYVTDQFKITLRSGESATHKIIRMLPSGYELGLIKSNPGTGYSQVRTKDGKTGYVLTRQLMKVASARDRLTRAEAQLAELQQEPDKLTARLVQLQREHQTLQKNYTTVKKEKDALGRELETIRRTASNAIRISNERNDLRKMVAQLTQQVENLKQENRELSNDSNQQWFMIGAAIIILGIIIGLILPHLRFQRRKSSWGSL